MANPAESEINARKKSWLTASNAAVVAASLKIEENEDTATCAFGGMSLAVRITPVTCISKVNMIVL